MLVPTSLLQSVECSTECKNSIFHCTIGFNKYKSSLASGASPQTPPGGLFLPPGPPPPAWVHAAHRHGMVSPRKVWFQRPCSSLVLVPEEVVEPASGRYNGPAFSGPGAYGHCWFDVLTSWLMADLWLLYQCFHLGTNGVVTCWASCFILLGDDCGASEAAPSPLMSRKCLPPSGRYVELSHTPKYEHSIAAVVVSSRA